MKTIGFSLLVVIILAGLNSCATHTAAERANIVVVKGFLNNVVSGGQLDKIDHYWTEDMVWHYGDDSIKGIENYKANMKAVVGKAFVDMKLEIKDVIASDDDVVVRFTNSGINKESFMGYPGTGRKATWHGIGIYRLKKGKIAEAWFTEDILSMLRQLKLVEHPSASIR